MKTLLLSAALALATAPLLTALPAAAGARPATVVTVWGRTWTVTSETHKPGYWRATRDWNNFNPFGQPARLRTVQAMQAFEAATGCKPVYKSMYQTITGDVLTQLSCPAAR